MAKIKIELLDDAGLNTPAVAIFRVRLRGESHAATLSPAAPSVEIEVNQISDLKIIEAVEKWTPPS